MRIPASVFRFKSIGISPSKREIFRNVRAAEQKYAQDQRMVTML